MKHFLTMALACTATFGLNAQVKENPPYPGEHMTCLNNMYYEQYCKEHGIDKHNNPQFNAYEAETQNFIRNNYASYRSGTRTIYVIPIVFHIVHLGGVENISDAQVKDAVAILNRDYNKMNSDTSLVVGPFKPIVANIGFEFRLAQRDALGNCVSGITRHYSPTTNDGDHGTINAVNMDLNGSTSTTATYYPRDKYLNIWVVKYAQGAAGYTNTPLGASFSSSKYDGIMVLHNYTGSIGTSSVLTSRTLTHEVGHWFNLSHCWGDSNNPGCNGTMMGPPCNGDDNCSVDDYVSDTPLTIGWTTCNLSGASCGSSLDNVQNYMEYSYCSRMFTEGQKARMIAAINSTLCSRNNLWSAANLALTGVDGSPNLCAADFNANSNVICAGDSITFSDMSYHGVTGWNWSFGSTASPATSTVQNPTVTYTTPGMYPVSLSATDGTSTVSATKTDYVTVLDPVGAWPWVYDNIEAVTGLPNSDWFIYNTDGQQKWALETGNGSSGVKCFKLDNFTFNNSGGKDGIISKTFDMSGASSIDISFKYAYRMRTSTDNEKLKLFATNNCGNSWSLRKQLVGDLIDPGVSATAFNSPAATDWKLFQCTTIPATYFTQGFQFKIEFESDAGNNIFIDDINIAITIGVDELVAQGVSFNVYPNPANGNTTIEYEMPTAQDIRIVLTDVLGQQVALLDQGMKPAGTNKTTFNAENLPSKGIYFVTIYSKGVSKTQKIVVE